VVFPRRAGAEPPAILARHRLALAPAHPAFCYWVAHALRQDLWRAMRGVRGFLPVALVRREGEGLSLAAAGLGRGWAEGARLDRLFARAGQWAGWAAARTEHTRTDGTGER
jgi:hypothetical protein